MGLPATYRADLLRAWQRSTADAEAQARLALRMGFVPEAVGRPDKPDSSAMLLEKPPSRAPQRALAVQPPRPAQLQARLPMLVRYEGLDDKLLPSAPPAAPQPALTRANCQARMAGGEPPALLLVAIPKLWPVLRASLSRQVQAGIDTPTLTRALAQGRTVRRVPRLQRWLWAGELHIVWDISERMQPYQADFSALVQDLMQRRGAANTLLWQVDGLPTRVQQAWAAQGKRWRELDVNPAPSPGRHATVLVLSDMGVLTPHSSPAASWAEWAGLRAKRGAQLVAWAPHGAAWVHPGLARVVKLRCLHAATGLRRQAGPAGNPGMDVARAASLAQDRDLLLAMAAFCHRLEPALLRRLRLLHPATAAEPAAESAAWAHWPVVGKGDDSRPVAPAFQLQLRQVFSQLPAALQRDALHTALWVHAWRGRSTAVADILAWDAHARPAAKGPQEQALVAEAQTWLAGAVETERLQPGAVPGMQDFAADLLSRHWGDTVLQQRQSPILSGLWVLIGSHCVPDGLDGRDLLSQARAFGKTPPAAPAYRLVLARGGLALLPDGLPRLPASASVLGPRLQSAMLDWRTDMGDARRLVRLQGQPEVLLAPGVPWPEAATLTLTTQRLHIEWQQRPAWARAWRVDTWGLAADMQIGGCKPTLRYIEPGSFQMGSPPDEPGRGSGEGPRHPVTITRGFWLADTPCTQALWQAVMRGNNPSHFRDGPNAADCPVEQVSWDDVQHFLKRLQALLPAGCEAGLPTEAEWEYAARAGSQTAYAWGDRPDAEKANMDNKLGRTTPVKQYPANAWGLHDLHGTVWEWCADARRPYRDRPEVDPSGGARGDTRVLRGGAWPSRAAYARAASRLRAPRGEAWPSNGFRLALRSPSPGGPGPVLPGGQDLEAGQRPAQAAGGSPGPAEPGGLWQRLKSASKKRP